MTIRRWSLQIAVPPSAVIEYDRPADCRRRELHDSSPRGQRHYRREVRKVHPCGIVRVLVGKLRPAAVQLGGSVVVVRSKLEGLTPHLVWGGRTDAVVLLERIKQKFDPKNILNPGRYIF